MVKMFAIWVLGNLCLFTTNCQAPLDHHLTIFSAGFHIKSVGKLSGKVASCCYLERRLPFISGDWMKELPPKGSCIPSACGRNSAKILRIFDFILVPHQRSFFPCREGSWTSSPSSSFNQPLKMRQTPSREQRRNVIRQGMSYLLWVNSTEITATDAITIID